LFWAHRYSLIFFSKMDEHSTLSTNQDLLEIVVDDAASIVSSLPTDMGSVNSQRDHISRCIITIFPPDQDTKWLHPETYWTDTKLISIWCGQFEIAPETGRLHAHLYVEFIHRFRPKFNTLRNVLLQTTGSNGNIQVARKCSKQQRASGVNYVLKPERAPDSEYYIWPLNKHKVSFSQELYEKKKSKKRSKQDEKDLQIDWIESKPMHWSWDQILHESNQSKRLLATCSWGPKYHAGRHASCPRRTIQHVIVFYGAGGTGKTTTAVNYDQQPDEPFESRYYRRNPDDGKFWGGGRTAYRGQRIIHFEKFSGQETAANFKEVCDIGKPGPSVNIKNSGIDLNHDTVLITSNHHPAAWYHRLCSNDNKQWTPICRRLTQVFFFPEHKPDGELNIPTANSPPYYEEQTDDFRNLIYDYEQARNHASIHWPLPELPTIDFGISN
jgi:hypothetical protein